MKIVRVNSEEYKQLFDTCSHVFNNVEFNELNRFKCEDIHYLTFIDDKDKVRMGIILGESATQLRSPFSAPFGGFEERKIQHINFINESVNALKEYGNRLNKSIIITFPPPCYDGLYDRFTRQALVCLSSYASLLYSDYNYCYRLSDFVDFRKHLWRNSKKNLSESFRSGLEFSYIENPSEKQIEEVYNIVYVNHKALGYPVHLSINDIIATSKIIDIDFFIVRKDNIGIASAIVYHTSKETLQVVYWSDLPDFRELRPMNFLAYKIIDWYYQLSEPAGLKYFDLGPASSSGEPSIGLCDFKESIGCKLSPKFTIQL